MRIVAQFIRLEAAKIPLKVLGETLWPYRAKNVAVLKKLAIREEGDTLKWITEAEAVRIVENGDEIARYSDSDYQKEVASRKATKEAKNRNRVQTPQAKLNASGDA